MADEPPLLPDASDLVERFFQMQRDAQKEFAFKAVASMAAPIACNQFYIQTFVDTTGQHVLSATIAFGGWQLLQKPYEPGAWWPVTQISSTFTLDRATITNLCVALLQYCRLTDEELRQARITYGFLSPESKP